MIFLGDIASPNRQTNNIIGEFFETYSQVFSQNKVVFNLEGLLADHDPNSDNQPVLFNHPHLPEQLKKHIDPVFCLANNHTLDLADQFENTKRILKNEDIPFCGAGNSPAEAGKPVRFYENENEILLFNACWNFLLYNHKNPTGNVFVAEIKENRLLKEVRKWRESSPNAHIVIYFHWSLDLEILPFPMYRQFAMDLIDVGANLVLGTHSHCIQGGEKYNGNIIFYGLGNFFIPSSIYAQGKLKFPSLSIMQLALDWNVSENKMKCHWFEFNDSIDNFSWQLKNSDEFETSELLHKYSPYKGLNRKEYVNFFKKNRRKKFLIPTYKNYKQIRTNAINTYLLKGRATTARFLAKIKLIGWQN
ncbi:MULTISPECIES: CapA family protein [unclassified Carboxylicivirga]|uniref:CapA family protein n=1 Tax=Carboxylicivirga TaxID=1628153 RepID=UPI003D357B3F